MTTSSRIATGLLLLAALAWSLRATADPFEAMPVAGDSELAELRGGIEFEQDGFQVRMSMGIDTLVDDVLVLRTEVTGDGAPRVESAGDPDHIQVIHRAGPFDLQAVVRNRVDGVALETVGTMNIEVRNFSARHAEIRDSLALQGVTDRLNQAGTGALQR
jgi:hypothetical protein